MLLTFVNGKPFQGRNIWNMANEVMASLKKALSLVPQLSLKIVRFGTTCRVVGYASGKNEQLFLQAIDKGMYNLDKNDQMGLSLDDDNKLGFSADDEDNGVISVVVKKIDVDLLMSNLKNGVIAPVGYSYTSKLAFICFGPVLKFYSPILSTGRSTYLSIVERKKGIRASIHKIQEEKAAIEHFTGIGRGVTQQNRMQFGLMAQNKDSAARENCDMRLDTIMKRLELTQKMIEMKMSMWEKMVVVDGAAKEKIYESIQDMFDKSEDLQIQLQDVGSQIILSVLSNVATLMGLDSGKTSGEVESDYYKDNLVQ
jgi:hypothetical protein